MESKKYLIRLLEHGSDKYSFLKDLPGNARVLDIGCGDCRRLRYRGYFRNDFVSYGIDIHEDEQCRAYLREFHRLDITKDKMPFGDEYFDLVVMSHVIEHLARDGALFCMKEIRRVLKQGGHVYVEFPSEKTQHFIAANTLNRFTLPVTTLNFYDDETHISLYSTQELIDVLHKENLRVCRQGDIREPVKKLLSPLLLLAGYVLRDKSVFTGSLWSLLNWSSFVLAKK